MPCRGSLQVWICLVLRFRCSKLWLLLCIAGSFCCYCPTTCSSTRDPVGHSPFTYWIGGPASSGTHAGPQCFFSDMHANFFRAWKAKHVGGGVDDVFWITKKTSIFADGVPLGRLLHHRAVSGGRSMGSQRTVPCGPRWQADTDQNV